MADSNPTRSRLRAEAQDHIAREQQKKIEAFEKVVAKYKELKELPYITAGRLDGESSPPARLAGPRLDYVLDCERVTHRTLTEPKEREAFMSVFDGDWNLDATKLSVVNRCGEAYLRSGLVPCQYFQPSRSHAVSLRERIVSTLAG